MSREPMESSAGGALRLQVGGTLIPGRDIYITRPEDALLFDLLRDGEYVNILSSRQVGKSSLMLRTALRLRDEAGHRFAVVDLTSLGTPDNAAAYFQGLVGEIAKQLKLSADPEAFRDEDTGTYTQQFIRFFRETVAAAIDGPVTLFFDEIDSTLKLPYTDDLYTALRAMYNERGLVPEYRRLGFCLVGVATPDELIKDRRTTPYNVGRTLWLGDFDPARDDLAPLVLTLSDDPARGRRLLNRALDWTGGHPFLTCRLCQDLRGEEVESPEAVDRYVIGRYATLDRLGEDVHIQQILRFVRDRLSDGLASFDLYARILKGQKERDQPSLAHAELKLSGLVKRDAEGWLVPRNRIYRRLFDRRWVNQTRPKQEVRRYRQLAIAAGVLLVLGLGGGLTYYQTTVVPLQTQDEARKSLEALGVTLGTNEIHGWADIGLPKAARDQPGAGPAEQDPARRRLEALRQALPFLATLGQTRDGGGLSLDLAGLNLTDADLAPLAGLAGLRALDLANNPALTDAAPLGTLTRLESLDLAGTGIADLRPLSGLTGLRRLDVSATPVSDIAPLAALKLLEELDLSRTLVKDLAPLFGLTGLRVLALDGLGIRDFNADGRLPRLKVLQDPVRNRAGPPGQAFRDCPDCPIMVVIPAGRFQMGSPAEEAGRTEDEGPRHPVTLARPFAIGRYEVRFDEWLLCVRAGACRLPADEGWGRGARPAINVSWDDARQYAAWLAKTSGRPYRLPSEGEWEYAARAGTTTSRSWGDGKEEACRYASVYDVRGKAAYGDVAPADWEAFPCDDGYPVTAPVGQFLPNGFGLYDTLGNVWEWVADCYHDSYEGAPAGPAAWVDGTECASGRRVIRGGSWGGDPADLRSATRDGVTPVARSDGLGFRLAQNLK